MAEERALQGVEVTAKGESLYGGDRVAVQRGGRDEAGILGATVHEHGAGPADADATTLFGSREAEVLTQHVDEASGRVYEKLEVLSVDAHIHDDSAHQASPPPSSTARTDSGVTGMLLTGCPMACLTSSSPRS